MYILHSLPPQFSNVNIICTFRETEYWTDMCRFLMNTGLGRLISKLTVAEGSN